VEFTLLGAVLVALGAMVLGLKLERRPQPERAFDQLLSAVIVGAFIGRLAAMLQVGVNPFIDPLQIVLVRGGVHTGVAALATVSWLVWRQRRSAYLLDGLASPALAGLAGWHASCVLRSTCLGAATDLPWSISLPGSAIGRHPVEVYAALLLIGGAVALNRLRLAPGMTAALALAWAGFARLATEQFRPSITGRPVWWYTAGLIGGGALALYLAGRPVTASPRSTD
jgi:prolipoprotein diacylglyceryltransferase